MSSQCSKCGQHEKVQDDWTKRILEAIADDNDLLLKNLNSFLKDLNTLLKDLQ